MIRQGRRVIAGVVRRHHDVALRCKQGSQRNRFGILQIRHVEGAIGGGAVRVQNDGALAAAVRAESAWNHEDRGGRGGFAGAADCGVLDVIENDIAKGGAADRQQQLVDGQFEFGEERRNREGGQKLGRSLQQRAAGRGRARIRAGRTSATTPAAGGKRECGD